MSDTLERLREGVFEFIEWESGPYAVSGNGIKLLEYDFDELEDQFKTIAEKLEDYEYNEEDLFVVDKMKFERTLANFLKSRVFDEEGYAIQLSDETVDKYMEDFTFLFLEEMERINGTGE